MNCIAHGHTLLYFLWIQCLRHYGVQWKESHPVALNMVNAIVGLTLYYIQRKESPGILRLIGCTLLSATHRIALGQFALIMRPHSVLVAQEGTESWFFLTIVRVSHTAPEILPSYWLAPNTNLPKACTIYVQSTCWYPDVTSVHSHCVVIRDGHFRYTSATPLFR